MDDLTYCEWVETSKGVICKHCRVHRPTPRNRNCTYSPKRVHKDSVCQYLGEVIDVALIQCKTCCGNVRIKYPVHECSIHGSCLSTYFPTELNDSQASLKLCIHCPQKILKLAD